MKNKRLAYVLLPVTVVIWGSIFFRVWSSLDQEAASPQPSQSSATLPVRPREGASTPKLQLNYPDPFLAGGYQTTVNPSAEQVSISSGRAVVHTPIAFKVLHPVTSPPPQSIASEIIWPRVEYLGAIENQRKNTRVAMVVINGGQYLLKEKSEQNGLRVETIGQDSIKVRFQQQGRVIHRLASK
ncbi:hypothetical protein J0X19_22855 [Hymenobacter sp. BT186]|uniref:Type II secretion system protein GspC N-terminal domain-containing protein n=1 Tax=Hymenobacter telluris TaxID=2816474 RepID=A0A939F3P6_9BACT|nr:hypothetical protein [Hymenobacter telluris]MBO0360818.1 hypothetical protein [Hymenobacter telluris]MBW3376847.1 hypothetical protein [Hymenobacter norwichensis]